MILRSISSFSRFAFARFVLTVAFESVSSFLVGRVTTSLLSGVAGGKWGERKCAPHLYAGRALFYKITSAPDSQTTQCRFNSCCPTLSRHLSELLTRLQRLISFRHIIAPLISLIIPVCSSIAFPSLLLPLPPSLGGSRPRSNVSRTCSHAQMAQSTTVIQ